MHPFSFRALALGILATASLGLAGCQQGIGDRCQVQADCDSGLICVIPPGQSPQVGGVCQSATAGDAGVGDLAVPQDLSVLGD